MHTPRVFLMPRVTLTISLGNLLLLIELQMKCTVWMLPRMLLPPRESGMI